ncbi:PorT family protein [Ornithobacterium rhinotracheale]|uniref:outer membrane beta-barrel protein n=1 Tax=Ornithobacterium rhinotracheale TaxID=28251 RepID=UPI001FF179BF|nr:outer membrane beta-barrel protein [Ornithobacterium rhinotracheale]MCK0202726.1 PorT family protein [Ornithobacterium rhinotracheale]
MKNIFLFFLLIFSFFCKAQLARDITYGAFVGGIYSKMGNLERAIIPDGIYTGYEVEEKGYPSIKMGLFLNWKYPSEKFSIQPEFYYSHQRTNFEYNDINGLSYNIKFSYHNLNGGFLFKYYVIDNFYVGAGPYLTFNLDKDALEYFSNGEEMARKTGVYFEPDIVVQKKLKQSFEGKDYFHVAFELGHEFNNNLNISIRYQLGLSDVLETQENGYRFRDTRNKVNAFALQIGYRFDFYGVNNF